MDGLVEEAVEVAARILVELEGLGEAVPVAGEALGSREAVASKAVDLTQEGGLDVTGREAGV